jgi:hypothetical protein
MFSANRPSVSSGLRIVPSEILSLAYTHFVVYTVAAPFEVTPPLSLLVRRTS